MDEKKKLETTQALAKHCKTCTLENCMRCPFEEFQTLFGDQIKENKRKWEKQTITSSEVGTISELGL